MLFMYQDVLDLVWTQIALLYSRIICEYSRMHVHEGKYRHELPCEPLTREVASLSPVTLSRLCVGCRLQP